MRVTLSPWCKSINYNYIKDLSANYLRNKFVGHGTYLSMEVIWPPISTWLQARNLLWRKAYLSMHTHRVKALVQQTV